jgi:uncharacterized protein YggE
MLHMQHAHVVDLLIRQHEAARLKARRDAVAKARRTAAATATAAGAEIDAGSPAARRPQVHRPRPA